MSLFRFKKFCGGCRGCGMAVGAMHAEECPVSGIFVQKKDLKE